MIHNRNGRTRQFVAAAMLVSNVMGLASSAGASEQILPWGSDPCEADWIRRSQFDRVKSVELLKFWERDAERGVMGMQLRLGLLRSSADGKWTAPADHSYNTKWLEKAQAQGSKSATWELAKLSRQTTPEDLLRSAIDAAESERNPWAATHLMNLTNGRWGKNFEPTKCLKEYAVGGECAPPEMLQISSASKWAEIAAEGGNASAQEWLCWSAMEGYPDRGQPKDHAAAFKWCQIAAHNACASLSTTGRLGAIYRRGKQVSADSARADQLRGYDNQPWRSHLNQFFSLP